MHPTKDRTFGHRTLLILATIGSIVACLVYAKWRWQLPIWWAENGGGIPYVSFWCLAWATVFPAKRNIAGICLGCVAFTTLLEFGQMFNPEPLADFRKTKIGAAWLGSGFDWNDIPPYFGGGLISYLFLSCATRVCKTKSNDSSH